MDDWRKKDREILWRGGCNSLSVMLMGPFLRRQQQYFIWLTKLLPLVELGVSVPSPLPGRGFLPSRKRPDRHWDPPSLLYNGYRGSFPEAKRLGLEADHLPPSTAEFKNEWSYTSSPPVCLHRVDRDIFTSFQASTAM